MSEHEQSEMQTPFERTLLLSARADAPPPQAAEQAWSRFAAVMGVAALSAAAPPACVLGASSAGARLLRLGAWKYVLIGALGGTALTIAWFEAHPSQARGTPAEGRVARVVLGSAAPVVSAPPADQATLAPHPSALLLQHLPSPASARRTHERLPAPPAPPARSGAFESATPATLAAETAALDAARNASAASAFQRALALLARYQQDFPHGVLRADADVVAIQTLAAAGDHAQAARRAMQFLSAYPNDPHAATLKRLLAR